MQETTMDDRRHELANLLDAIARHPEREWSKERQRIAVLREMLAAPDRSRTATA